MKLKYLTIVNLMFSRRFLAPLYLMNPTINYFYQGKTVTFFFDISVLINKLKIMSFNLLHDLYRLVIEKWNNLYYLYK